MTGPIAEKDLQTRAWLAGRLRALGVNAGDIVCAHVAMSSLGLVIGGARTVADALLDAVAPGGSIMMPSFSGDLSDPAEWRHPPVATALIDEVRAAIPAYDPVRTPTRGMGVVAEYFRTYPGVLRSPHPQSSFCAFGPAAEELVAVHAFDDRFGPASPLGRLCDLGGKVLLLGAPFDTVSLFHMTQHMMGKVPRIAKRAPVIEYGVRRWASYSDIDYPTEWFEDGVAHLIKIGLAATTEIGQGLSVLFPAAPAVDALVKWRRQTGRLGAALSP